jgi:SNF2 family DNA or RNA helicase
VGQQRNVVVQRFVMRGSVEERILALQEQKRVLANGVLAAGARAVSKDQQLADLRLLFGF